MSHPILPDHPQLTEDSDEPIIEYPTYHATENQYGKGLVINWASLIDANCLDQATAISRVPILEGHLALMPDAHFGYGPPVGSALKTRDAVMPYAVGVDIGCGMIAVRTDIDRDGLRGLEGRILGKIRELIPSGVHTARKKWEAENYQSDMVVAHAKPLPQWDEFVREYDFPVGAFKHPRGDQSLMATAAMQFGTLGAGNHFVEVCEDSDNKVWLLLHSGSRGIGNQLATMHVKIAQDNMELGMLENKEFAFFERYSIEFNDYLSDMLWCQFYAYHQRQAMMDNLVRAVATEYPRDFTSLQVINCHHNYAEELEPGLWLTRKGAIDASPGTLGIIPGSMGAATYIVQGKGNALAYNTSPHGAGRLLGRNVARKTLSVADFKAQMGDRTWMDRDAEKLLDEAPNSYKPIEQVINDSHDLIEPLHILSQFINYKGL